MEKTQNVAKKDKIEISSEALVLQKGNSVEAARQEKVQQLQQKVQSGEYQVNAKETARKLYDFWNGE